MAEVLQQYEWPTDRRKKTKYPYDKWLDGSIWKLEKMKDYESKTDNILTLLKGKAKSEGKGLVFDVKENEIVFQAVPK